MTAVREMRVAAVAVAVRSRQPLLLLQECAGHERVLAIEIRISEATMLEEELAGRQPSRPAPHHLAGDVITACGRHLVGVCINMFEHDVFDAEIVLDDGDPVPARPGDAVALALYTGAPILANVDALNQAGLNPRHVIDVDAGDEAYLTGLRPSPTSRVVVGWVRGLRSAGRRRTACRSPLMNRVSRLVWPCGRPSDRSPTMTLPRTVADVLADHVVFEVECIDRMYLNVYVPGLQYAAGLVAYVHRQLDLPIASTAPLGKISDGFSAAMHRFARDQRVPWVDFVKGERKDDVMHAHLAEFTGQEGVLFIGRAQERTGLFRTEKRRNADGRAYPWIVRSTGMVNHFYVYAVDADFGPFFLKFCSYFPYNARLCINGHEWAKRQAIKAGIGHTALDNGFATCTDPGALQTICDRLGPAQIQALLDKWLQILPGAFTESDRAAGYRYELSILQAEFSLTQVLDRPVSGRVFFEQVIRDNLDAGRPDQVSLIFDRKLMRRGPRSTPGRFRTRVITNGVTPSVHIDYKNTRIKQYHKEERALRTETTINDPGDFKIRKRLTHLPELREIGFSANRRLLGVQRLSHNPIRAAEAFTAVHDPIVTDDGTRVAGLRLGDRRAHGLLQALLVFRLLPNGFLNRDLRGLLAELLGREPDQISAGQVSYDLRRLRAHGLIARVPHSHRYRITDTGLHHAMLITHLQTRVLQPGLAQLTDPAPPAPTALRTAARNYQRALDNLTQEAGLAA